MNKRTTSKHAHRPKIAAKAQRSAQDIVRSSSNSRKRSLGAGSTESPPKDTGPKQDLLHSENPAKALENALEAADNESKKVVESYSTAANVRSYQAILLEMAQANMQFAFEFAQRLATVRSPFEFLSVIAESTNKRIAMFQRYSEEMAAVRVLR